LEGRGRRQTLERKAGEGGRYEGGVPEEGKGGSRRTQSGRYLNARRYAFLETESREVKILGKGTPKTVKKSVEVLARRLKNSIGGEKK